MAADRSPPRVFSVPSGVPFLPTLAAALLDGRLPSPASPEPDDPLALADLTVFLPTRRAARAFAAVLAERLGGNAILPAIRPLGDVDADDHLLASALPADRLLVPPAVSRLVRQLKLTELTLAWRRALPRAALGLRPEEPLLIPASAADAARLAADLARLFDDMAMAGIPFDALTALVPEDHAAYFQVTLEFLKVAGELWPAWLSQEGRADPVARRDELLRLEAARLAHAGAPVIAAGSTGSIPATAELLAAIARLPHGAVVLPGLDSRLDPEGWNAIGTGEGDAAEGHPQRALKRLLATLGVGREDVTPLGEAAPVLADRARLVSETLRPAATTDRWANREGLSSVRRAAAFADVGLIVARNEQEEALAIAVAIREALETQATSVAVVTPDRALARRLAAELRRWDLAVDDSAGAPLDRLAAGVFARLLLDALGDNGDPVALLALLKHPAAAFGLPRADCRRAARILELACLRGRRVVGGMAALPEAVAEARRQRWEGEARVARAVRRLTGQDWALAGTLAERVAAALAPLDRRLAVDAEVTLGEAAALLAAALAAAATDDQGEDHLKAAAGGGALADLLAELAAPDTPALDLHPRELPALFATLMADLSVTRPAGADPRVHIWGTLEARLQSADVVIAAGLDEGVWPAAVRTDPFLSRAMRGELGLPPPEQRTGLAAHDFSEAICQPRVLLSRAEKRDGAPTVASRWLQRLEAVLGAEETAALRVRGDVHVERARALDRVTRPQPVAAPEPKPPLAARPQALSVTEIETLVRDPYAVYAKHVLKLEELDPVAMAPDYALRGTLIHKALGDFTRTWQAPFDDAAVAALTAIGRDTLDAVRDFPDVHAIWSARFADIARWFVAWERGRDGDIAARHAEIDGALEIATPAGPFRLRGRADRVDVRADGALDILDFKTGTPPTATQVMVGFSPQLGLEAAMAQRGGFDAAFAGRSVATLAWIGLSRVGRDEPVRSAVERGWQADAVAERVYEQLVALITAFAEPTRAYVSRARPMFETRYESPYDHLARVREWGLVESEEDLLISTWTSTR